MEYITFECFLDLRNTVIKELAGSEEAVVVEGSDTDLFAEGELFSGGDGGDGFRFVPTDPCFEVSASLLEVSISLLEVSTSLVLGGSMDLEIIVGGASGLEST